MKAPLLPADEPSSTEEGSSACVASAWAAHETELRAYLRHRLADEAAADDVLQDVFVKALRQRGAFCSLDNPRAWLFHVARNVVIDRARTAHPAEPIDVHEDQLEAPAIESPAPVDALADCLTKAIGRLTVADAAIVLACDIQGQSQRDFAAEHALTLPAAKSRLLRARQRLRQQLTAFCGVRFGEDGRVCCHTGPADRATRPS